MASTTPARKAVKTTQLPQTIGASPPMNQIQDPPNVQQATVFTVAMTAINFIAFLFSLVAVDLHYTLRRSAMGATVPDIMPRWLHRILRPTKPYENYYRTKQKKLMRLEAEEAFRLRNRTLVVLGFSILAGIAVAWYFARRVYQRWIQAHDY